MPNKKISQLDVRTSPSLADLLAIADPSTGYAYKITGTNLQTVLEIPNKVPYTGATASVNLGAYNITATNIIRAGGLATQFLKADGSVDSTTYMNRAIYDTDGNGVVDAAEKMQTIGRNSTGVTLYKGTIVYISGSTGNRPNFVKAQANSEATSAGTFGVVVSDIANNSDGYVATIGTLADLDTRTTATNPFTSVTLADGDTLYLDPNTAGYVTNVKPSAPNHIVYVGKVVRTSPTLGTIVYRIQNGYELNEIHDVSISSVANNDVLVYETATTLWKNKSIATILGYTPQAAITLTTTGSSGASTFVSNTLNIPTYTLAGLGGQPQLNGTGFIKATGTTISYDNTTYAADSLVVHLAGAENITGVKTFQNALQTTAGNNLLNTGGGNTVIGYTADPASSATYKLDVNGSQKIAGGLFVFGGTYTSNVGMIWKDSAYGLAISGSGTNYSTSLFSSGGLYVFRVPQGGQLIEFVGSQRNLGAIQQNSGHNFLNYTDSSTYIGYTSVQPTIYKLDVNGTARIVSNLNLAAYTTSSSVPGTVAGLLGFDSSGNVITSAAGITGSGAAGQVTYWSGTSAVTGSNNLVWDATNSRLSIAAGASPAYRLQVHGSMRVGTTAASAMYWDDTNSRLGIGVTSPTGTLHVVGSGTTFDHNISINGLLLGKGNNNISSNTQFGAFSLISVTTGTFNTALSESSLRSLTTGQYNIAIGVNALRYITSANFNVSIGHNSLANTSNNSSNNVGIGQSALGSNTANNNTGVGYFAIAYNSTGTDNVAIGYNSGVFIADGTTANSTGSQSIYIGSGTKANALSQSNQIVIGYNVTGNGTNTTTIGNSSILATYLAGRTILSASTTSRSSLNIVSGTAPTSPNDGDIWYDGTNIYIRVGTTTKTFTIL